jgi:prepilin-type processing-associated H-X9-DG protein
MRKFFTLVELLIIIAIISILASLLLPALKTAKEKVNEIDCASKLKQLGAAFIMYVSDYNDCLPPHSFTNSEGTKTWPPLIKGFLGLEYVSYNTSAGGYENPEAIKNSRPFLCSSDKTPYKIASWVNPRDCSKGSYAYPRFMSEVRMSRLKENIACLVEGGVDTVPYIYYYKKDSGSALYYLNGLDNRAKSNHRDGMNVLFIDSHVKWHKRMELPSDAWLESAP